MYPATSGKNVIPMFIKLQEIPKAVPTRFFSTTSGIRPQITPAYVEYPIPMRTIGISSQLQLSSQGFKQAEIEKAEIKISEENMTISVLLPYLSSNRPTGGSPKTPTS